jgi:SRSO17 transposase
MRPLDSDALNQQRLALWRAHPWLKPQAQGVLILDATGDPKRRSRSELAAEQCLGKLGHVANGVVAGTRHWADGTRHVPVGVKPSRPASRLPRGRTDPAFHTKPELAWQLIEEARAAEIPFHLVVADRVYGENALLESRLFAAKIPYVLGLKPSHGTWQFVADFVADEAHPPASPPRQRSACHGKRGNARYGRTRMARHSCAPSPSSSWGRATVPPAACA